MLPSSLHDGIVPVHHPATDDKLSVAERGDVEDFREMNFNTAGRGLLAIIDRLAPRPQLPRMGGTKEDSGT